jgi:glutathione S-transferase
MLTLVIGDRNFSSWSLRPWLAARQAGLPFTEVAIRLDQLTPEEIRQLFAVGQGALPDRRGRRQTPADLGLAGDLRIPRRARARRCGPPRRRSAPRRGRSAPRCIPDSCHCASRCRWMFAPAGRASRDHAGGLCRYRAHRGHLGGLSQSLCDRGPFLFGAFSIADAMYAPVVWRFRHLRCRLCRRLRKPGSQSMLTLPAMREWQAGALAEPL